MISNKVRDFLELKAEHYNAEWFIEKDPVSIPHLFTGKEDIEISGFLTAGISWGQRAQILKKARLLMDWMGMEPYRFVTDAGEQELRVLSKFVYRTFNGIDCQYFISALRKIYINHGGLEKVITEGYETDRRVYSALESFRRLFMSFSPMDRTGKHLANVAKGSSAKRLNMFLRWMVRDDGRIDFGLWKKINPADLMIPLDVHVGRVARELGLLERKQNDWKAVEELTSKLRMLRPHDPVYYDYALFGSGVFEKHTHKAL